VISAPCGWVIETLTSEAPESCAPPRGLRSVAPGNSGPTPVCRKGFGFRRRRVVVFEEYESPFSCLKELSGSFPFPIMASQHRHFAPPSARLRSAQGLCLSFPPFTVPKIISQLRVQIRACGGRRASHRRSEISAVRGAGVPEKSLSLALPASPASSRGLLSGGFFWRISGAAGALDVFRAKKTPPRHTGLQSPDFLSPSTTEEVLGGLPRPLREFTSFFSRNFTDFKINRLKSFLIGAHALPYLLYPPVTNCVQ